MWKCHSIIHYLFLYPAWCTSVTLHRETFSLGQHLPEGSDLYAVEKLWLLFQFKKKMKGSNWAKNILLSTLWALVKFIRLDQRPLDVKSGLLQEEKQLRSWSKSKVHNLGKAGKRTRQVRQVSKWHVADIGYTDHTQVHAGSPKTLLWGHQSMETVHREAGKRRQSHQTIGLTVLKTMSTGLGTCKSLIVTCGEIPVFLNSIYIKAWALEKLLLPWSYRPRFFLRFFFIAVLLT